MKIELSKVGDVAIVKVSGRIDSSTADSFWQTTDQILASGTSNFIVDCANLEFISSAGLRALLTLSKNIRQKSGIISLCCLSQQTKAVMDIAGILAFFKTYANLEEALSHY